MIDFIGLKKFFDSEVKRLGAHRWGLLLCSKTTGAQVVVSFQDDRLCQTIWHNKRLSWTQATLINDLIVRGWSTVNDCLPKYDVTVESGLVTGTVQPQ